jgi:hypothetical protein
MSHKKRFRRTRIDDIKVKKRFKFRISRETIRKSGLRRFFRGIRRIFGDVVNLTVFWNLNDCVNFVGS